MGITVNVWATDPENKPAERKTFTDDTAGRLHSGYMEANENGKPVPVALTEWRLSTGDMNVARNVAELFGGSPVENAESTSENFIDVFTAASSVPVIIEADGISADMKQWVGGKLAHHCDGVNFLSHPLSESKIGTNCGCPHLFAERKEAAKAGMGPNPSIEVKFRFAADPELGVFKWQTGSWTLLAVLHEVANAMDEIGAPVLADLILEEVSFVGKKGKMKGQRIEYTKPVIKVRKAYNDAIADEH